MEQTLNVERIRSFLEKKQPQNHPILEHPLDQQEEYVQMLYIDILCVFAQYENAGTTAALNFVQRLMAGLNMTEPVTDHIKEAMELSEERFSEFLHQCLENGLEQIFLLDAMMVSCAAGSPTRRQLEFLAETADALRLSRSCVEYLSRFACVILKQDSEGYHDVCNELPRDFCNSFLPQIICYLKQFVVGVLIDTKELLYLYAAEKTPYIVREGAFCNRRVVIDNLILRCEEEFRQFDFQSCDTVEFNNCDIKGCTFTFSAVSHVILRNCTFEGLGQMKRADSLFYLSSGCNELHIDSCQFINFTLSRGLGFGNRCLFFCIGLSTNIFISDSSFENICGNGYILIANNAEVSLLRCRFIRCHIEDGRGVLFGNITSNDECIFRDSVRLIS